MVLALAVNVVVLPLVETLVVMVDSFAVIGRTALFVPLALQALLAYVPTHRACCWKTYFQPWLAATSHTDRVDHAT